ncbi:amidohydrolase family protein, partial [Candidatus Woesearchaeota archaeon]|nr:amidohydrolase family protein [Candidatus Woesearchaeota archaeon]
MSILIKDVLLDGKKNSVYIEENKIAEIGKKRDADTIIDGKDKALIPPFVNSHTHAAMTLVRSYADDMNLFEWLNTKIWPIEAKMSDDDVYWGTKLACLEMIKSGTTCFNDMYWHAFASGRAVEEMGIRAYLSAVFIDMFDKEKAEEQIRINENLWKRFQGFPDRIKFALGPHAPYTVSKESLEWARDFAKENN